jgi:hypothetical protein
MNKFIIDKEINLNEQDYLKTKVYADNLSQIIKNTEPNKVFTIGLFGSWGTGKSSIIETSKQEFDQTKEKFITYDAWQYVNDSFRRMFLRKLREDLKYEETDLMKKFYENESTDIGNKYLLSSTRLAFIVGGLILLLAILTFIPFELEYKFPVYSIVTLLGLIITIISGAFHQLKIAVTKPHLFAPEQFEECFKEIVSNSFKKSKKPRKWITGNNSIQNLKKLVIVIDNIDRCSNDIAYNLLTDIKTFLSSEPCSIVFVIPVDDEALRKHILSRTNDDNCDKDKEEFLRKFFNVTIRIKPYGETDMFSFAKQLCEKSGIAFKPETINIASKEYAKNPRRIIQLFNNLLAELNYYNIDFVQRNETLICCILIIREEYSNFYKRIVNSPATFIEVKIEENDTEELRRFLSIIKSTIEKTDIATLSKILTNSELQFAELDADIKDAIETFNSTKIFEIFERQKEIIIDYIIYKFDFSIKNNLIDTDFVNYFNLVAEINTKYPLEQSINRRIDEKISNYLQKIIELSNHNDLCIYALNKEIQGNNTLKREIVKKCKTKENQEKQTYWQSLFNAVLKNFDDEETSKELCNTYTINHSFVEKSKELFSKMQIAYLISDKYIQDRIAELPTNEDGEILLDIKTKEYNEVKWLFEKKKNISESTYGHFFAHIIGKSNDETRMRGKSIDEIAEILQFANPCLELVPDRKLNNQPVTLYDLIVNDRSIPNPNYHNQPRHDQHKNFIDECIAEDKYITDIIHFVINIYRISNNNTDVSNEIEKLLKKKSLDDKFIELINKGYTLSPIINLIFSDDENYDSKRLFLLKYCFNHKKDDKTYTILDDKAKSKLEALLIFAQKENSSEVYALLESLIEQERYKVILGNLIVAKDTAFINSLPQKLLKLAINSFRKDNFNDFANNFELLSAILTNGDNTQKGYIVKILTNKLDNKKDIEQVLKLIDSMSDISAFDKSNLLYSHIDNYGRENNDIIEENIKTEIDRIKGKIKPKS